MESQIAELTAQVAALQSSAGVTNTGFAEVFYYLTIPLMIIIHAGFLAYEMGASRAKNVLSSGTKNLLAFAWKHSTTRPGRAHWRGAQPAVSPASA